jgi:hypothetical protein
LSWRRWSWPPPPRPRQFQQFQCRSFNRTLGVGASKMATLW